VYPTHCSFTAVEDEDALARTLVCNEIDAMGYWSSGSSEVDFLARVGGRTVPIAVNLRDRIAPVDLRGIRNFCRRFKIDRGVVVTREDRGRMDWAELVPLHVFSVYPEKYLAPPVYV
jgi:predicted AAA+ superfamily ATPase